MFIAILAFLGSFAVIWGVIQAIYDAGYRQAMKDEGH